MLKEVKLGDICCFENGDRGKNYPSQTAFISEGIPFINAGNLSDNLINSQGVNFISEEHFNRLSNGKVQINDILFCLRGSLGKYAINKNVTKGAIASSLVILRAKEDIHYKYLSYFLLTPAFKEMVGKANNGSSQPNLSASSVKNFKIPLPPLPQQQKIANILDAADELRQNDKALIAKYDELTQALFLDMFGDPMRNPKGWKLKEGSKYYEVRGRVGWKGYKKTDLRQSGAIVLGATHINNLGTIDLSKVVFLSQEKYIESPEIMVQKHDLIFVQRGNTIGKIALVRDELGEATINPVVLIFRPINANPFFLLYLLMNKGLNREFVGSNSGSAQPMITQKTMKEFLMIDGPVSLQNQFAERVAVIEEQKAIAQKSLEKSEELFNSLLQKAFKGELIEELV